MMFVSPSALATIMLATTGVGLIAAPVLVDLPTRLIWNASASVPIGLYVVRPIDRIKVGDLVVVEPPAPVRRLAIARGYLAPNVPLIKHVAALSGQTVCRQDRLVTVDAVALASALERDARNHPLPIWSGCQRLTDDQVFLLNYNASASLDGRYFGPTDSSAVAGRLTPIWTVTQP